jgi:hydrogenase maturation factor
MTPAERHLPTGKLPPDILERCLAKIPRADARVIVWPGIGEDAAVVEVGGALLVAKTDPITFATELIGWYAVHINANDVACMGATPRWFMADLLLPGGTTPEQAETIFDQMLEACGALGISLIGGHSEITVGLDRPIVIGCLLGEIEGKRPILSSGAKPGDAIIITKGIAVEGTALLAREAKQRLLQAGVGEEVVERARRLLFEPGLSVVRDAEVARGAAAVTSLHDPTEGGLATGLEEVAKASGVGLEVDLDQIPILPETRRVCSALGLDPLGLLGSGCLIVTVEPGESDAVVSALERAGIRARRIGTVLPASEGLTLLAAGQKQRFRRFERDEVARFFEAM